MLDIQSDVSSSGVLKQDGDMRYVDLGGKKRASASEFKGQRYINIREYYVDKASGEEKPGKKGIALNAEQVRYATPSEPCLAHNGTSGKSSSRTSTRWTNCSLPSRPCCLLRSKPLLRLLSILCLNEYYG